jgi:hypothetical protein
LDHAGQRLDDQGEPATVTTTTCSQEDLVRQPIGYWSGEAYRRVADAIRSSLAANGLSQPQWWILNRLEDTSRAWTRAGLVEELASYGNKGTAMVGMLVQTCTASPRASSAATPSVPAGSGG